MTRQSSIFFLWLVSLIDLLSTLVGLSLGLVEGWPPLWWATEYPIPFVLFYLGVTAFLVRVANESYRRGLPQFGRLLVWTPILTRGFASVWNVILILKQPM